MSPTMPGAFPPLKGGGLIEERHRLSRRLRLLPVSNTDRYAGYNWLPRNRHEARKGWEANRNEGLPSVFRRKLNRLVRRTKRYSKREEMLTGSLALLRPHQGWI